MVSHAPELLPQARHRHGRAGLLREPHRDADQQQRIAEADANAALAQAKKDANKGKSIVERRKETILDGPTKLPAQAGLGTGSKREAMRKAVDQDRAIVERDVQDTAAKKRDEDAIEALESDLIEFAAMVQEAERKLREPVVIGHEVAA